jgi:hypothetical protein
MSADQNLLSEIEKSYLLFFRRRGETALAGEASYNLLWRALESLAEAGDPEWWETVEIDGVPSILVFVKDAATIIQLDEEAKSAKTTYVGPLDGGTYEEVISSPGDDYALEGTFEHKRLPGKITIRAAGWSQFDAISDARAKFRDLASSPARARVHTYPAT